MVSEAQAATVDPAAPLLVIDDDRRLLALIQRYLQDSGFRVTAAHDAKEARAYLNNLDFDLIVLDVMMPGESGLDLTRDLRRTSDVPVLLLTARGSPEDRIAGLEIGADDYMAKPFEPRELVLRIQTIIRRARRAEPTQPRMLRFGSCTFDLDKGELMRNGKVVHVTAAELSLLRLFCEHPREQLTREQLCEHTGVALERSVDVQVTRLRRKIEPNPRVPIYLQTVRGIGYTLMTD